MTQIAQLRPAIGESEADYANRRRTQGHVIDCDGTRAIILAEVDPAVDYKENYWAVGLLITILEGRNRVVGQSYKVENAGDGWIEGGSNYLRIYLELVGEITERDDGSQSFSTGIAQYPRMGSIAHRIRSGDLQAIYKAGAYNTITVGHLTQEASIPAKIDLEKLLSRHFAVVGSTGVGKSTSVSLILRKIIAERKDLRILILDPHAEFTAAFANESVVKDASSLQLPFWMFRFEEITEVIFRGQKGLEQEAELLRDLIADAKERFTQQDGNQENKLVRKTSGRNGFTADSPVPYRIIDLLKLIDERLGLLEGKHEKPLLKALKDRIVSINRDPRFEFMFGNANAGGDKLQQVITEIFRLPINNKPISVVEMSGLPSEVVSSVVSVLCRMAFDLALSSDGGVQTLVVCEEAHRYIPADEKAGFWPTRQAIARIAKEGRKYGVYLGIITQRPSELDPTIFSQCNTVFAMRLSNTADQKIIGGALTNGAQTTVGFLASIANREAIAFGEGLKTPMRLTFETISKELLPGSHIYEMQEAVRNGKEIDIGAVLRRMRNSEPAARPEEDLPSIADLGEQISLPSREPAEPVKVLPAGIQRQIVPPTPGQPIPGQATPGQPLTGAQLRRPQPSPDQRADYGAGLRNPSQSANSLLPQTSAPMRNEQSPAQQRPAAPMPPPRTYVEPPKPAAGNSLINAFRRGN